MAIRAVLFDVGGPLDTELESERAKDAAIRAAVEAEGRNVSDAEYAAANDWAVGCFASDTYQTIIWRLLGPDVPACQRAYSAFAAGGPRREGFEPRPGMGEVLRSLHERGVQLGLAANQPAAVLSRLDAAGMGRYFHHREVSGTHGFRKPDVRLFLRACADLGVQPEECVMAGDRMDNDIVPARLLGMRTVLFRTGRHRNQQPRTWEELPDAEVQNVAELAASLTALLNRP